MAVAKADIDELAGLLGDALRDRQLELLYADPRIPGFPYPWQVAFHEAGRDRRLRAMIAGNQVGKTRTMAAETAMHLTGWYPGWWKGRRFNRPIHAMVAGPSNQAVRDVEQAALLGTISESRGPAGGGWIPVVSLAKWTFRQCGIADVIDQLFVNHRRGGQSVCSFKSYEQGPDKFQGVQMDLIWLDEEPQDARIFSECLARLVARNGILAFTRTPLFGMSTIVRHFLESPEAWHINATWDDAPHLDAGARAELLASFPQHERDTRTRGIPMMGTGGVYDCDEGKYLVEPFPIPGHWRRIAGIDFGIEHPTAVLWLAWDDDADVVYAYDEYRVKGEVPAVHAVALNRRGSWIPVAWPHDGLIRDKGSAKPLVDLYREHKVNLLMEPASWESETRDSRGWHAQSREAGNITILERMRSGRFKVFTICQLYRQELRQLHRKDGLIVQRDDDLESASRYAVMMLRYSTGDRAAQPLQTTVARYDPFARRRT